MYNKYCDKHLQINDTGKETEWDEEREIGQSWDGAISNKGEISSADIGEVGRKTVSPAELVRMEVIEDCGKLFGVQ